MGRRAIPTADKELRGNPGKRSVNKEEPKAVAGLAPCPKHVTGEAHREWTRMGRQLLREHRMALSYKAAFALYCIAWGRWVDAEKELKKGGTIVKTPNGFMVQSPYLAIANKAMEQLTKALSHLGISPTSQAKVSKVKVGAKVTRFEAFLEGKTDRG